MFTRLLKTTKSSKAMVPKQEYELMKKLPDCTHKKVTKF